jgi:hypothetical protein
LEEEKGWDGQQWTVIGRRFLHSLSEKPVFASRRRKKIHQSAVVKSRVCVQVEKKRDGKEKWDGNGELWENGKWKKVEKEGKASELVMRQSLGMPAP